MNKSIFSLISALMISVLPAEVLIDSVFTKNSANWYALKNFGSAKGDRHHPSG